ncbi:hypothetical protein CLU79DRAFT_149538 [Phycomyces nitens]|nr:hypothetical protein CLU79DRAFT_149538 [Phycomyces nitens]
MQFPTTTIYTPPYAHNDSYLNGLTDQPTALETTKSPKNEKPKRKQVKNACVNCQKACKKCDDGRPCQRCVKLGLTMTCSNSERKERKKGMKRGPYKKRQRQTSSSASYDQGSYMANEWYPTNGYTVPSCPAPMVREAPKRATLWLEEQQHQVYPTLSTEESALVHALPMLDTGYIQSSTTPSLAQSSPLSSPHSRDETYQTSYPGSTSPISLTTKTTPYLVQPTESTPGFVPSYPLGPISPDISGVTFELPISLPLSTYQNNIQPIYYPQPPKDIIPCDIPSQSSWLDQPIQQLQQFQQFQQFQQQNNNNNYHHHQQQQQQMQQQQSTTWQSFMATRF